MQIIQHSRNVHELRYDLSNGKRREQAVKLALMSDIHWDNPHCQRDLLKKHLDLCLKESRHVLINGDFFCLMQGKYDPRRSKKDIRPEHNVANYLDAVIEDAINWFAPYKDIITLIGYGNHEKSIINHTETDPLRRFVDLFNFKHKANIQLGGYGGWVKIQTDIQKKENAPYRIKYYHGSGGGGPVTRGQINLTRLNSYVDNADMIWIGHIHENSHTSIRKETLNNLNRVIHSDIELVITPSYKEEYKDGYSGFHVERGRPPKPIGCKFMDLSLDINYSKNRSRIYSLIPRIWDMK